MDKLTGLAFVLFFLILYIIPMEQQERKEGPYFETSIDYEEHIPSEYAQSFNGIDDYIDLNEYPHPQNNKGGF